MPLSGTQPAPSADRFSDPTQTIARLPVGSTAGRHASPSLRSLPFAGSIRRLIGSGAGPVVSAGRLTTISFAAQEAKYDAPSSVTRTAWSDPTRHA